MATSPRYIDTPIIGHGSITTGVTAVDGTGSLTTVVATTTLATLVTRLRFVTTVNPADSVLNVFVSDGTTTWLYDSVDISDQATSSTTVASFKTELLFDDLVLPVGYSLKASCTVTPTSGTVEVSAHGGTFSS